MTLSLFLAIVGTTFVVLTPLCLPRRKTRDRVPLDRD